QFFLRPSLEDFARLNQLVTVYSYDTEYTADPENSIDPELFPYPGIHDRLNFNQINPNDINNPFFSTSGILGRQIGNRRALAVLRWRDGLVDLNGDGDLDDEFILQPVADFDEAPQNGDATDPHSQLTYRERGNPNFQDPTVSDENIYPAYLNIKSVADLALVPFNEITPTLYATSMDAAGTSQLEKITFPAGGPGPNTTPVPGSGGAWNSDLEPTGGTTALAFRTTASGGTGFTIPVPDGPTATNLPGGLEGTHPSYAPRIGGFPSDLFVFQRTDTGTPELWVADAATGAPVVQCPTNGLPLPAFTFGGAPGPAPFDLLSDLSGPDWNRSGSFFDFDRVAYALGTGIDISPGPTPITVQGNIYQHRVFLGLPGAVRITNFSGGTEGAFYPDWHPDGQSLVFTHVDLTDPNNPFRIATIDAD
ncbi:MAG TPA: hypothetical protein VEI97_17915, partial [bacterium]|nr:hypothetical protein [bacterium]